MTRAGCVIEPNWTILPKLGNWLRNRSDALEKGWSLSLAAEDPKSAKDRILEPVDGMRDASGKSE